MDSLLLPLFPLELVLYPGQSQALHIFEERYKEMIGESIKNDTEFGIILAKDNSIANVGCSATISQVTKRYDDGRMDIDIRGRRRFEVLFLDQERSFMRAAVQFFGDEEGENVNADDRRRAVSLHGEVLELLYNDSEERQRHQVTEDSQPLSFPLVAPLPVDNDFKQSLLASRSENERMLRVNDCLEKLLSHLRLVTKVRQRAGSNGHGR